MNSPARLCDSDPRSSPAPQMMATTSSSSLTTPATQMMATTSMKSRMQTLFGLSHIVPKTKTVQNEHLHKFAEIIAEMPYDFCTATNCDVNEKRCLCCKSPAPKFVCKWHHMNVCTGCYATAHRLCRNCVAMIGERLPKMNREHAACVLQATTPPQCAQPATLSPSLAPLNPSLAPLTILRRQMRTWRSSARLAYA